MKEPTTIVEYGVPIDPKVMIEPHDPETLELEPGHPGLGDAEYVARRKELFALCRRHRLEQLGPPIIEYTSEETRIWREVTPKLDELHRQHACSIYLEAKDALGISTTEIPQLRLLSDRLDQTTHVHLIPAEGPLAYRSFYSHIAERGFPVTQFIRHGSHPEFTPEPDMLHDCVGHVPSLMNHDYTEVLMLIGRAAHTTPDPLKVLALKRFSWYSIEFGLIEDAGEIKVFGAGILSPTGEIPFSLFSKDVTRRPFMTAEVIETDYDPSRKPPLHHPVLRVAARRDRRAGAALRHFGVVTRAVARGVLRPAILAGGFLPGDVTLCDTPALSVLTAAAG